VPSTWTVRESVENGVRKQEFEGVRKDEIEFSKAAETITDATTLGSGESAGQYVFAGTKTTTKLGENIREGGEKGTTPIFTYYKYATIAAAATTAASSTLTQVTPPAEGFTKAEAKEVAAVSVTFNLAPPDKKRPEGRTVDLNTLNTFAFGAPNAENPIVAGPCE
jgi:hypothetical protein